MTNTQHCRHCGAPFQGSRTGYTVHCPAHRTPESRKETGAKAGVGGVEREYEVRFTRTDGVSGVAYVFAAPRMVRRAARDRAPVGATIHSVSEVVS